MKNTFVSVLFLLFAIVSYGQTMQGTIKPGITPKTMDIYLKSSSSFSQKDEAMTFVLAIPTSVGPAPNMGSAGVTANTTGPVTGITGLQPNFLINNLGSTQREVVVSTETINSTSYFIYTFIFAGTAPSNHNWDTNEQLIFSIQFNGCTSNCNPVTELLVNLPNGGANSNAFWYFQPNTLGDITNYATPFYENPQSTTANNGGSTDGSELSTIGLVNAVSLPVTLKALNIKANGCNINIIWEVESEINALYYGIERSENATDYNTVGRINATAQSTSTKTYSFTDNTASFGTFYYRLRMGSLDGTFTYSAVQKTNLNCSVKGDVSIYPTLSNGLINVRLIAGYENAKLKIINSLGEEVLSDVSKMLFRQINLKGHANGTYFVQVINDNKIVDMVKFVLAH